MAVSEIEPKLSRLYREASNETPPPALDAAILAAARNPVAQAQRRAGTRGWWRNWMAPASAIATLALGVSLALLIERERPDAVDENSIRGAAPQSQSAPAPHAGEAAKAQGADRAAPALETNGATKPSVPARAPAPPRAERPPSSTQSVRAAPGAKSVAPDAAKGTNIAGEAAQGALGASAPADPATADRLAPMRQKAEQRSPEAWLEEIARLRREGRDEEAAEQLAQFRKVYPAHPLPQNLRAQ